MANKYQCRVLGAAPTTNHVAPSLRRPSQRTRANQVLDFFGLDNGDTAAKDDRHAEVLRDPFHLLLAVSQSHPMPFESPLTSRVVNGCEWHA